MKKCLGGSDAWSSRGKFKDPTKPLLCFKSRSHGIPFIPISPNPKSECSPFHPYTTIHTPLSLSLFKSRSSLPFPLFVTSDAVTPPPSSHSLHIYLQNPGRGKGYQSSYIVISTPFYPLLPSRHEQYENQDHHYPRSEKANSLLFAFL